jgi:hypothetical protein
LTKIQALSTRAVVLLTLDERIGSEAMREGREATKSLTNKVDQKTEQEWTQLSGNELKRRRSEYYSELILQTKKDDIKEYMKLLDTCGFLETMGHVVRHNYIPFEDIYQLFSAMILTNANIFEGHIKKMRREDDDESLYEHFTWLADETRKRDSLSKVANRIKDNMTANDESLYDITIWLVEQIRKREYQGKARKRIETR